MAEDLSGTELAVGDVVLVPARVVSVTGDVMTVETTELDPVTGRPGKFILPGSQCVLSEPPLPADLADARDKFAAGLAAELLSLLVPSHRGITDAVLEDVAALAYKAGVAYARQVQQESGWDERWTTTEQAQQPQPDAAVSVTHATKPAAQERYADATDM